MQIALSFSGRWFSMLWFDDLYPVVSSNKLFLGTSIQFNPTNVSSHPAKLEVTPGASQYRHLPLSQHRHLLPRPLSYISLTLDLFVSLSPIGTVCWRERDPDKGWWGRLSEEPPAEWRCCNVVSFFLVVLRGKMELQFLFILSSFFSYNLECLSWALKLVTCFEGKRQDSKFKPNMLGVTCWYASKGQGFTRGQKNQCK